MNEEIKVLNHFEEAGFDGEQSKAMVVGIDDLLVKSMAAFREYFDHRFNALEHRFGAIDHRFNALEHRFSAIDHRFNALENSVRSLQNFQLISLISLVAAMLFGFAGLIFAILSQS